MSYVHEPLARSDTSRQRAAGLPPSGPPNRAAEFVCRAIIAVIAVLPVWLGATHGILNLEHNPVLESALAGAFVIHLWTRPRWIECAAVVLMGAVSSLGYYHWHHGFGPYLAAEPSACFAFAGLGSLGVLLWRSLTGHAASRNTLADAAAFPYFSFVLALALNLTTAFHPRVYDLVLYAFDESLRIKPSFLAGHLIATSTLLRMASVLVYQNLPLAICGLLALQRMRAERFSVDVIKQFVIAGLAGAALYNLFPAVGPIYVFGRHFPETLPPASSLLIHAISIPTAARNCMPSVHFACALLIWWNTARLSYVWRAPAAVFLAFTALATLGTGEHYLVDLVVAVPFAVAVYALSLRARTWTRESWTAIWGGAALTLGWIGVLRLELLQNSFWLAWCGLLITVALSLWWKRGLRRRERESDSLYGENVAEIPDHQDGVPVVDPADQMRPVQTHADARQTDSDDLGRGDRKAGAKMQQGPNKRAGFGDAQFEAHQRRQKIQDLQV